MRSLFIIHSEFLRSCIVNVGRSRDFGVCVTVDCVADLTKELVTSIQNVDMSGLKVFNLHIQKSPLDSRNEDNGFLDQFGLKGTVR